MPPSPSGPRIGTPASESRATFQHRFFPQAARHHTARAIRPNLRSRRKKLIRFLHARRRLPLTTYALAGDYLVLCRNPLKDLNRWVLESGKRHKGRSPFRSTNWRNAHAQNTSPGLASRAHGFRDHQLHAMPGRLDPARREWGQGYCLSSRPGAGAGHYDRLRSLRNEVGGSAPSAESDAEGHGEVAPPSSLASEIAGAKGYYAARIAAARQSLSPAALALAIRAIKNEQTAAIRAIIERWEGYFQNNKRPTAPNRPRSAQPLLRYPGLRKS